MKAQSSLAAAYQIVPLGTVADIIPGRHLLEETHNRAKQGIPYLTGPSDFGLIQATASRWTETPDAMCAPGDVLVTVKGAGVAKINFAPDVPACIGRQLMAVRAKEGIADGSFLFCSITRGGQKARKQAIGATVPGLSIEHLYNLPISFPSLSEQRRIAAWLTAQVATVEIARTAVEAQKERFLDALLLTAIRQTLGVAGVTIRTVGEVLHEVTKGTGENWADFPIYGATRAGLALAKEPAGKTPWRYKPVEPGTIFYNPMRILIGSIAMLANDVPPGITSPDYVVLKAVHKIMEPLWFYEWLRSLLGAQFISTLARGAVRERLLFERLAQGSIPVPPLDDSTALL